MSKTVNQWKKKPVIVEAVQYTEYGKLVKGMCNSVSCFNSGNNTPHVHTIHDNQIVILEVGDYILPEPDGEHFYPVKPDIFHSTYEPVTTPSPDVAGSDAVAFAEWIGANYVTNGPGIWSRERDMQRAVTPKYSSSQLYAKFLEEHPQPAGGSVEEAAHDYVKGMLGDYDPELQEEYDAILAHVLKGVELAGAAFQAAQGGNCVFCGEPCEPAPTERDWTSVSPGTGLHFECAGRVSSQAIPINQITRADGLPYVKDFMEIRTAVADYFATEGCGCWESPNHQEVKDRLCRLLTMKKREDGSGYDYTLYTTP